MNLKFRPLVPVFAALLLSACAAPLPPQSLQPDPGPKPTAAQAEAAIHAYLKEHLRDYPSMRDLVIAEPKPMAWTRPHNAFERYGSAWMYCLRYNTKNGYGGYVGTQSDRVALRMDESVVKPVLVVDWDTATRGC